jgi:transposase
MAKHRMSTFERLESGRLNRKQRRELGRQVAVADPGLTIVHANAGGIDVGNESHYVAVPPDRDPNPVREFGCWTAALNQMAEWLKSCRIDTVAMQATGVYWIALYDVLEQHGIQVVLANAQHTKNVPGRKTDVQECQWLMKLHTYGLLRDSFRLAQEMESVRTIWRLRDRHVKEAGRAVQHIQKALTKMNIQLANVISDINGLSGQEIIAAILQGERDPWKLADLKHYRVRASPAAADLQVTQVPAIGWWASGPFFRDANISGGGPLPEAGRGRWSFARARLKASSNRASSKGFNR